MEEKKKRTIKAWIVLAGKNPAATLTTYKAGQVRFLYDVFTRKKDAENDIYRKGSKAIRCTITYELQ